MESEFENFKKEKGIYLEEALGVKEWAFSRDDALKLLDIMRKTNMVCYGGDVIRGEDKGFVYDYGFWSYERNENETQEQY
ncbi:MAG: hypothetical protein EOM67_15900, partial [Spirochaetia bacterium]|nr:hypothetical protein [Spirochaetia bacterium]